MAASPSLRSPSHGRETSHTLRLAAGALLDNESVMLAVPEICTSSLSNGVVYNNLCGECRFSNCNLEVIQNYGWSIREPPLKCTVYLTMDISSCFSLYKRIAWQKTNAAFQITSQKRLCRHPVHLVLVAVNGYSMALCKASEPPTIGSVSPVFLRSTVSLVPDLG